MHCLELFKVSSSLSPRRARHSPHGSYRPSTTKYTRPARQRLFHFRRKDMTTPPANSGPYRYQPFPAFGGPHIRIATILPGQFHDDVIVMLRLVKFKANTNRDSWVRKRLKFGKEKQEKGSTSWPHYEALSYVWGPVEEHSAKIRVSHLSRYGTQLGGWLPARRNLMSALRHLRRADRPRDLWIDAICIDQDDDVAKGPQVAMMGDIYQRAASVVVWLGPGTQNTPSAFAWLEDFGESSQEMTVTL